MLKVILETADNGIIKIIQDDNINGAGAKFESKNVYDLSNDENHNRKITFLYELAEDLGIETGNKYCSNNLTIGVDWGVSYRPTAEELKYKIDKLEALTKQLKIEYRKINK